MSAAVQHTWPEQQFERQARAGRDLQESKDFDIRHAEFRPILKYETQPGPSFLFLKIYYWCLVQLVLLLLLPCTSSSW